MTKKKQEENKLLFELVKNARENIDTIAKHCGFSRQKAYRMINQLEQEKLIWGYSAIFDEEKIGLKHYIVMVKGTPKQIPDKEANNIISKRAKNLAEELEITLESTIFVHGEYDWIFMFTAKDIIQAKKFTEYLNAWHPFDIEKKTILQTMMFIRRHYVMNPEKEKLKDFL